MALRVAHIIASLGMGGAEGMLLKLLTSADREKLSTMVITLLGEEEHDATVRTLGIPVFNLGSSRGRVPSLKTWTRLFRVLRDWSPDVIQGWMYHANVAASTVGRVASPRARIVWNVRHSLHDIRHESHITRWAIRAGAWLSGSPAKILYNSETSRVQHEAIGFRRSKGMVVPNGFDVERFRPSYEDRVAMRAEIGLDPDVPLVVQVGRLHPMKGHEVLVRAVRQARDRIPGLVAWVVGPEDAYSQSCLERCIAENGMSDEIRYLGPRSDAERVYAAADVVCLASLWGEGFPNTLGEAMACGVLCVATRVGDCPQIVGDSGQIVEPGDPEAFANAIVELLSMAAADRDRLGLAARERVVRDYSLIQVSRRYEELYAGLVAQSG